MEVRADFTDFTTRVARELRGGREGCPGSTAEGARVRELVK